MMLNQEQTGFPVQKERPLPRGLAVRSQEGFSLVEALVCIGILFILAMILLPAYQTVRERGRSAKCVQNLRQLWQGSKAFAQDRNGRFPSLNIEKTSASPTAPGFRDYLGYPNNVLQDTTYSCPQAQAGKNASGGNMHRSYSVSRLMVANWDANGLVAVVKGALEYARKVEYPSHALYLADGVAAGAIASGKGINYATNINWANDQNAGYIHGGRCNGVFLDGHVAALTRDDLDKPQSNALWGGSSLD